MKRIVDYATYTLTGLCALLLFIPLGWECFWWHVRLIQQAGSYWSL